MTSAFFFFFVGLFGHVVCQGNDPNVCTSDNGYPAEGYAPSCKYKCSNGQEYETCNYDDATFCFVFYGKGNTTLHHLGKCVNGECEPENRAADRTLPHQWDGKYHQCKDLESYQEPVVNCTYICAKERASYELPEYYYGIYKTPSKCWLGSEVGVCVSGICHSGKDFPQIDQGPQQPPQ
ncbi:uncharacterized protein LOC8041159 [Ixodes scapularis]|uniref:uncharacterized protein LOC8041159 n=1 Tax=Ixodes scapularis TaxID=6945 RepID=UPI001A9E6452|nr:uncharacterized protein LOC8041159 [Ixodes scapularis]